MDGDVPTVTILLLGDHGVGKSTFLSRLSLGDRTQHPSDGILSSHSLPRLRDLDQPFIFDVSLYRRPYRFQFYDTSSPESFTLLQPDFIILCYSIPNRDSLLSLSSKWKHAVETHFNYDERLPVMVLGLQRDLRRDEETCVMPQEGLGVAQAMRCDRYAECSALSGELCQQVLEDVARTAAKTTTSAGGKSEGGCDIM